MASQERRLRQPHSLEADHRRWWVRHFEWLQRVWNVDRVESSQLFWLEIFEMWDRRIISDRNDAEQVLGLFEASDNDPRQFFEPIRLDAELKLKAGDRGQRGGL